MSTFEKQKLTKKILKENIDIIKNNPDAKLKSDKPIDGAVVPSLDEIREVVIAKRTAFLQRQRDYRAQYLAVCILHEELKEMQKHIDNYMKEYDLELKRSMYVIPMLWEGYSYPIDILKAYYNLKHNSYSNSIMTLNKIREQLITDYGLKQKECDDILIESKYIQDSPKIKD